MESRSLNPLTDVQFSFEGYCRMMGEFPEVLTDTEHGGEASTPAHRKNCHRCALEYALWQR